jgi:hypothetical protein
MIEAGFRKRRGAKETDPVFKKLGACPAASRDDWARDGQRRLGDPLESIDEQPPPASVS